MAVSISNSFSSERYARSKIASIKPCCWTIVKFVIWIGPFSGIFLFKVLFAKGDVFSVQIYPIFERPYRLLENEMEIEIGIILKRGMSASN